MRNVFLTGLISFLIVAGASFCISWYIQASEIKKHFEQTVAGINTAAPYITYDSVTTSGFPTTVNLTVTNPKFSGRLDTVLAAAQTDTGTNPVPAPLPQWQQEAALAGDITFSVNAMSNHYSVLVSGEWSQTATVGGNTYSTITQSDGDMLCSLTLDRSSWFSDLWNYRIFEGEHTQELLKLVRAFDCSLNSYQVLDSYNNNLLMSSGPTRLYLTNAPEGDLHNIRLYMKATDSEVTPAGDTLINAFAAAFSPGYPFPMNFSLYGKQNLEMDLAFKGPADFTQASKDSPVEINLANLYVSNNLYNSKGHFYFSNAVAAGNKSTTLNTRFESTYTEQYETLLKEIIENFIRQTATSNDPELYALKNMIESRGPEESYALIQPIIPQLHSMGTMVQSFNGSYAGSPDYMKGDYNLADFTLATSMYGLSGSGTARMTGTSLFPEANLTFNCSNCLQMVDDLLGYAGRVSGVIQAFSAEPPPFFITPRLIDGTKKFLSELSDAPPEEKQKGNFTYVLRSTTQGEPTINGRNMGAVMAMYSEYIGQEAMQPEGTVSPEGWKID